MHTSLLEIIADPVSHRPLELTAARTRGEEIMAGRLADEGRSYEIIDGIPRFVGTADVGQRQTELSFGYKWTQLESFGSPGMRAELHDWLIERYGFVSADDMCGFFAGRRRILDAGCGAGFATSAWMREGWSDGGAEWIGLDISVAVDVARSRLERLGGTHFVQGDVLHPPFRAGVFDTIMSEGVLHHTPSTSRAFNALVPLLAPGGELMFYVYRQKAPIREFTDDYVRAQLASLEPEKAWDALRPFTRLGKALADLRVEVDVPEDVPLLGIKAGRHDIQRLLYWHVAKLFWNDRMTFEENNHVNFDWYAPRYAHRHNEQEVRGWCDAAGLDIRHFNVHEAGFTVRAIKPA